MRNIPFALCLMMLASPAFVQGDDAPATKEVMAGPLKVAIPTSWKQQQPENRLRLAEFVIPANGEGTEDLLLVLSGPFGGTRRDNVSRWIASFESEGRTSKVSEGQCEQGKYVFVDLSGTYKKPVGPPIMGKTELTPDSRMFGVMLETTNGNFFFKIAGPKKSMEPVEQPLRQMIGGDAEQEKPVEFN